MNKIKIAVVGLGVGEHHIMAYQQLPDYYDVRAICALEADTCKRVAEKYAIPKTCRTLDEVCRLEDIDVIDLCTPPFLHFDQIHQVINSGRDAICEKPLVGSLEKMDDLIKLEQDSGRSLMPILNYRFGNGARRLKRLIASGITGKAYLSTVEVAWRRKMDYYSVPWRGRYETELGGTLMSHGIHGLDLLLYIMGPIKSLFAHGATRVNPIQVEDCLAVSMTLADGSLATFADTTGSTEQITRHRFCFANLTAESNLMPYQDSHDPWKFIPDTPEVGEQIKTEMEGFIPEEEDFVGQFKAYALSRLNHTTPPITLQDARNTLEVITGIYYSANTGERVDFPIAKTHPYYKGWFNQ